MQLHLESIEAVLGAETKAALKDLRSEMFRMIWLQGGALATLILGLAVSPVQPQPDGEEPPGYWTTYADELRSGGEGPLMVGIDPGTFRMGCVSGFRCADNEPVREMTIAQPFDLSVHEVTVADFRRFVEATGHVTDAEHATRKWPAGKPFSRMAALTIPRAKRDCIGFSAEHLRATRNGIIVRRMSAVLWTWKQPGFESSDRHPVVCVSWSDAREYVNWLAEETGEPYRLPSEAEWEFAARAGPLAHDDYDNPSAWCDWKKDREHFRRTGVQSKQCMPLPGPTPVGSHGPNAFGLYDIGTNVTEWTEDCWSRSLRDLPGDGSARTAGNCSKRTGRDNRYILQAPPHESRAGHTLRRSINWSGIRVAKTPDYTY